jgi:hypothetical protein
MRHIIDNNGLNENGLGGMGEGIVNENGREGERK